MNKDVELALQIALMVYTPAWVGQLQREFASAALLHVADHVPVGWARDRWLVDICR